jgi:hypothetical protein
MIGDPAKLGDRLVEVDARARVGDAEEPAGTSHEVGEPAVVARTCGAELG